MPFKMTPFALSLPIIIPSPEKDLLIIIFGNLFFNWAIYSSSIIKLLGCIIIWGFNPNIFFVRSVLKPFITDITIIKIATPSIMPRNEKIEIIFKKPSFFLGLRFLDEINLSTFVNNILISKFRLNFIQA